MTTIVLIVAGLIVATLFVLGSAAVAMAGMDVREEEWG